MRSTGIMRYMIPSIQQQIMMIQLKVVPISVQYTDECLNCIVQSLPRTPLICLIQTVQDHAIDDHRYPTKDDDLVETDRNPDPVR